MRLLKRGYRIAALAALIPTSLRAAGRSANRETPAQADRVTAEMVIRPHTSNHTFITYMAAW